MKALLHLLLTVLIISSNVLLAQTSNESYEDVAHIPGPLTRDFKLYVDKPLLPLGSSGSWDSGLLDPGGVIFHEGKFHMIYNAVPFFPSKIAAGYAVSSDGISWVRVVTQPVFTIENIDWKPKPENIRINSVIVADKTWIIYFSASSAINNLTGVVGRATASSPTGPWIVDSEPVLRPGETGEWDAGAIGHVDVIHYDDEYKMYYSCNAGIGLATSKDGRHWTKYDDPKTIESNFAKSDPILMKSNAEDPNVQKTLWGWAMVFRFKNTLNYAVSSDGIHWIEEKANPILSLPGKDIWYSSFVVHNNTAFLFFESGNESTSTYLATWKEKSLQ